MAEKAIFAAGCFWGVEAKFRALDGVIDTRVGYTDGHVANPDYQLVCTGQTGHAEAVEVVFDASQISYGDLLDVFWQSHDPTTLNRQGPDIGTQYRSGIYYVDTLQKEQAEQAKETVQQTKFDPVAVVTEIKPATTFYEAEDYHQQYLAKRRGFFK